MAPQDYCSYDALGLAALVKAKKAKPAEIMDAAIARAEALNPTLNAIVFTDYEGARAAAKGKLPKGAFTGVPMLLKDMRANVVGWPTRSGSRYVPATPATADSNTVANFKAAGLIPFGKTNVPEFGILPTTECKLYGPARSPWNLEHSTGGSSGGSAAAVRRRDRADRACHGRRRLDPHSRIGLRPGRPQIDARVASARAPSGGRDQRSFDGRRGEQERARHRRGARCAQHDRLWRSLLGAAEGRLLSRRHQAQAQAPQDRRQPQDDERHAARPRSHRRGEGHRQAVREPGPSCRDRRSAGRRRCAGQCLLDDLVRQRGLQSGEPAAIDRQATVARRGRRLDAGPLRDRQERHRGAAHPGAPDHDACRPPDGGVASDLRLLAHRDAGPARR